ncbi:hypothetical protein [Lacimicrobium sp. SS2-24]|uniref:hypothetical protein n=1 Tax=Lacimicrobium sp. SS2-24 TaxID=2005569 RepID=UPI000B4B4D82|nr:hypothetical protein [Lacimicrobium sp. SS2-24]
MEHNYLNYFPELKGMSDTRQYILLEEARYETFRQPGMNIKMIGCLIITLLVSALIALLPPLIVPMYSVRIISMLAGILGGIVLFRKLYAGLLYQGLQKVIKARLAGES